MEITAKRFGKLEYTVLGMQSANLSLLLLTICISVCGGEPSPQKVRVDNAITTEQSTFPVNFFPLRLQVGKFICHAMTKQGWNKNYAEVQKNDQANPGHVAFGAFYECHLNGRDQGAIVISVSKPGFKHATIDQGQSAGTCSVEAIGAGEHSTEFPPHEPSRQALQSQFSQKAMKLKFCQNPK